MNRCFKLSDMRFVYGDNRMNYGAVYNISTELRNETLKLDNVSPKENNVSPGTSPKPRKSAILLYRRMADFFNVSAS